MPSATGLSNFFQKKYDVPEKSYSGYGSGYQLSNLDVIFQKMARKKTISESKLWDLIHVENDPNFSRRKHSEKHMRILSKLSSMSTILTSVHSQLYAAGVHEFFPTNMNELIFNILTLSDTTVSTMNNFDDFSIYAQIEQSFLKDLQIQLYGKTITFSDMENIAREVSRNLHNKEAIKNDSIRPLLSLHLQNFIPVELSGVFTTLDYLDLLNGSLSGNFKDLFDAEIQNAINLFNSNTELSELVSPTNYTGEYISFSDPLGLNLQSEFENELSSGYSASVSGIVSDIGESYGLSTEEINSFSSVIGNSFSASLENTLSTGLIALPSLLDIGTGIDIAANNETISAINASFDSLFSGVITELGFTQSAAVFGDIKPLDHLVNIKTNILKRLEYSTMGAASEEFEKIDAYLKSVIAQDTKNITETLVVELKDKLDSV